MSKNISRSFSIRPCHLADLDSILEIEKKAFPDPYDRSIFLRLLAVEPEGFFVAARGAEVLGYVTAVSDGRDATIYSIAISESARRAGVGSALIEEELRFLSTKAERVFLQVSANNPAAISLYKRFSFVEVGRIKRYYQTGEDALTMRLELPVTHRWRTARRTPAVEGDS